MVCLGLIATASVATAQTGNRPTARASPSPPDELREHQLRVLREHVLARTLDSSRKMEEAGLRLSARNQLLTYLSSDKAPSTEKETLVNQLVLDALTDLRDQSEELAPFMLSYLSNDLGSWIQKHRPSLTDNFEEAVKANARVDGSQRIRSLLELDNGDVLAAKRIRQDLAAQSDVKGLKFWLEELMKRQSREFEPLASYIIERAGQGEMSFETLFWVSGIYLRPQISEALRNRFLAMVVARTQPAYFITEPAPQMAYDLLTEILPFVQRSVPELYDQALNQHLALRATLSERQRLSEARNKRLKESTTPIEDLVSSAETAKSKTERNELLLQAAQLALEKKRFDVCLDVLGQVDTNVKVPDSGSWQRSVDQILKSFVRLALAEDRTDHAEKAAARIDSSLPKVEALSLIMRYYAKANAVSEAQRLLVEASKVAASASDDAQKAKAFFLLSILCEQVDSTKKSELLLLGINALNNLSRPETGARDKTPYHDYVLRLDNSGYELTKGFYGLTKQDENSALALVEKIQKRDLRTFALIGILLGLND